MKNTRSKSFGKTALALAAALLVGSSAVRADGREDELWRAGFWWMTDPIEGLWNVNVTITNCATGAALATFPAMGLFARGGTFHDTNGGAASPPSSRSSSFGVWKHVRGRTYEFAFQLFRFNSTGQPIGTQIVRHMVTLARDGESYTSSGSSEAFDTSGVLIPGPPTGCSTSTATRFE